MNYWERNEALLDAQRDHDGVQVRASVILLAMLIGASIGTALGWIACM